MLCFKVVVEKVVERSAQPLVRPPTINPQLAAKFHSHGDPACRVYSLRDLGLYGHMLRVSNFFTDRISQSSRSFLKQEDCVPVQAVEAGPTDLVSLGRSDSRGRAR